MTKPAPNASMQLLESIVEESIDSDYRARGDSDTKQPRVSVIGLLTGVIAGLLIGMYATSVTRPAMATNERAELIGQVEQAIQTNRELDENIDMVRAEIDDLQAQLAPGDTPVDPGLVVAAGTQSVTGPGVVLTITENPDEDHGVLVDQDLRVVTNALWLAGAEAIAINGHRLTPQTAIRQAGGAITINYNSLTSPFVIQAIGDSSTLAGEFSTGTGAGWLIFLQQNYGVGWNLEKHTSVEITGDDTAGLRYAEVHRR